MNEKRPHLRLTSVVTDLSADLNRQADKSGGVCPFQLRSWHRISFELAQATNLGSGQERVPYRARFDRIISKIS